MRLQITNHLSTQPTDARTAMEPRKYLFTRISPANRVATRGYRRIRRRKKINPVGNVGTGPDAHFCKKDNFLRVLENTNFPPIF
jgi:hypothetical protein